jgi:hypothetical protein
MALSPPSNASRKRVTGLKARNATGPKIMTAVTRAVAVSGPVPGTPVKRLAAWSWRAALLQFMIQRLNALVEPAPLDQQLLDQKANPSPQLWCLLHQDVRQGLGQLGLPTWPSR